ncbi:MAG: 5-oxoprolinase subunit PxpB [Betaproteobacteria bacterium]|nr:5-oxoprolinase subunit PxpB [Betaproteobacteria bacterium]
MARSLAVTPKSIAPLGDAAVIIDFADGVDITINAGIQRLARAVRRKKVPWLIDIVPGIGSLAFHFDVAVAVDAVAATEALVSECLARGLHLIDDPVRTIEVPICYDETFGLDLGELSASLNMPVAEIGLRHAACDFSVLMMGFAPGHPYLGGLDARLAVPRRATPRASVPGGSVGIANGQSVIYPYSLPGGWNIIGRTPLKLFDASEPEPSTLEPGDAVRFFAIDRAEFDRNALAEGTA